MMHLIGNRACRRAAQALCGVVPGAAIAHASDHKDSPYTRDHPAADIGDTFIFEGLKPVG